MAKFRGIPIPSNASPELVAALQAVEQWVLDRDKEPRQLPSFTVAELATLDAADWVDCEVICSNESGGRTTANSNGSAWKRVKDGATVS